MSISLKNKSTLISVRGFICVISVLFCLLLSSFSLAAMEDYGVFLGIGSERINILKNYSTVVLEPSEFKAEHIDSLHEEGKKVYAYINLGALEKYRPYYERFEKLTLGTYKNWPDERWIDVSSSEWQAFIVNELAGSYFDMGFDGFFIDNADVYYHYQNEEIFKGVCDILRGLKSLNTRLIINGGDLFVSRCIDEGRANALFDGINQETVFMSINFENSSYGLQGEAETLYFKAYLSRVKKAGLSVYLLEYGAKPKLSEEINKYCRENGFIWYNAKDLELK